MYIIDQKHNNTSNLSYDILVSGISKIILMVVNFIYIPVALEYLGVEKYGIWSTILSIVSWISYLDLGIGNGLRNQLTESLNGKAGYTPRELISSAYAFICIIILFVTSILLFLIRLVDWSVFFDVQGYDHELVVVITESLLFVALNFVFNLYISVLFAMQKAAIVAVIQVLSSILNLGFIKLLSCFISGDIISFAFIYGFSILIVNVFYNIYFYKKNMDICPRISDIHFHIGKSIAKVGILFFFIQICALILFSTDNCIVSYIFGASYVTPYTAMISIFLSISNLYTALLAPVWSAVTKSKTKKQARDIIYIYNKLLTLLVLFICIDIVMIVFYRPFSVFWLKKEFIYSNRIIILGGIFCFLNMWCNLHAYLLNGMGVLKASLIIGFLQAIINIPLSVIFATVLNWNSDGVLMGTVLSMIFAAFVQPFLFRREVNSIKKEI